MVIKGKLIIDFIKGDTEKKEVKFWKESDKFLKSKNKYFFEYYQFDDYYSKPSFHASIDGEHLRELMIAHELNAIRENRIYPSFCHFVRVYEVLNQLELNKDIWKNIF